MSYPPSTSGPWETSNAPSSLKRKSSQKIWNAKESKTPRISAKSTPSTELIDTLDNLILKPAIAYMALKQHHAYDHVDATDTGVELYEAVMDVIIDFERFKEFLTYRGESAQTLLDALQALLDNNVVEEKFRIISISALAALAIHSRLYPGRLNLSVQNVKYHKSGVGNRIADGFLDGAMVRITFKKRSSSISEEQAWFRRVMLHAQLSHQNVVPLYGLCPSNDQNYFPGLVIPLWKNIGAEFESGVLNSPGIVLSLLSDVAIGMSYVQESQLIDDESCELELAIFDMHTNPPLVQGRILPVSPRFDVAAAAIKYSVGDNFVELYCDNFVELYCDLGLWSNTGFLGNINCFDSISWTIITTVLEDEDPDLFESGFCPAGYLYEGLNQTLWQLVQDCKVVPILTPSEVIARLQVAKQSWDIEVEIQTRETDFIVESAMVFLDSSLEQPTQPEELCCSFLDVFRNLSKYRHFLECRTERAQVLIDAIQTLLDKGIMEQKFRTIFIIALLALAMQSTQYPRRLMLQDVTYQLEELNNSTDGDIDGFLKGKEVKIVFKGIHSNIKKVR
ncbi:hypothetical protein H0H92_000655 [Tricholoma furcatifolium]|nr:hypothetical protein H0H92_000655 [Tricholoma furcatifolium]